MVPCVPLTKHFRKNASSPKMGELGQNNSSVLYQAEFADEKNLAVPQAPKAHNKMAVFSFYCKELLLCLIVIGMIIFQPKITSSIFLQA